MSWGLPRRRSPIRPTRRVGEGKALRGEMAGTFTKNLLLRDKKRQLYLIVAHEDRDIDLKTLHARIGASGRQRFASAEQMQELLGVGPGSLTPLAIINDADGLITVVIDASLMSAVQFSFHPLANTESTGISPKDLKAFIGSCGREAVITSLEG